MANCIPLKPIILHTCALWWAKHIFDSITTQNVRGQSLKFLKPANHMFPSVIMVPSPLVTALDERGLAFPVIHEINALL